MPAQAIHQRCELLGVGAERRLRVAPGASQFARTQSHRRPEAHLPRVQGHTGKPAARAAGRSEAPAKSFASSERAANRRVAAPMATSISETKNSLRTHG